MKKGDENRRGSWTERASAMVLGVLTQDQPTVPAGGTAEGVVTRIL